MDSNGMGSGNAPHWHILGAGSLGTVLRYRLGEAGVPCTLLSHRTATVQALIIGNARHRVPVAALDALPDRSIQRLLITTKAGRIAEALGLVRRKLAADAVLLTPANGLGFPETLVTDAGERPVERAVSTAAAYRDEGGPIVLAAIGDTRVGSVAGGTAAPWFEDSLARLVDWQWEDRIAVAVQRKFAINCVINPLTARRRCRNGELLDGGSAEEELVALAREVETNLRAMALWEDSVALDQRVREVCASTAANRSSMLQDVMAGRPTEIEFLTGALLARREGIKNPPPAPRCEALYAALRIRVNPEET